MMDMRWKYTCWMLVALILNGHFYTDAGVYAVVVKTCTLICIYLIIFFISEKYGRKLLHIMGKRNVVFLLTK